VEYAAEEHETNLSRKWSQARKPKPREYLEPPTSRGDFRKAFAKAAGAGRSAIRGTGSNITTRWNPSRQQSFGSTASLPFTTRPRAPRTSKGISAGFRSVATTTCAFFRPFVGGAFGAGLRPQYQLFLAVMAALELKRQVRVTLTRQQMFTLGRRPTDASSESRSVRRRMARSGA
jgi:xanthine dehydrogenase YagR molybdenum-binding subunit